MGLIEEKKKIWNNLKNYITLNKKSLLNRKNKTISTSYASLTSRWFQNKKKKMDEVISNSYVTLYRLLLSRI